MNEERRKYPLTIDFNERQFTRIEIDLHYEKNHPDITDQTILNLVRLLDGGNYLVEAERGGFRYVKVVQHWQGKNYRIILTYSDADFLGVVNVFRIK